MTTQPIIPKEFNKALGQRLKSLRENTSSCNNRPCTQELLAQKLQVGNQTISRWEKGERIPDIVTLLGICSFFNITLNEFFNFHDQELADVGFSWEFSGSGISVTLDNTRDTLYRQEIAQRRGLFLDIVVNKFSLSDLMQSDKYPYVPG